MTRAAETSAELPGSPDTLLSDWFREPDREKARDRLQELFELHAEPLVHRIVHLKLGPAAYADAGDICQLVHYKLVSQFERLKSSGDHNAISNVLGYISTVARNACNEAFRSRKPMWRSLSMKLRYVATHDPRFSIWDIDEATEVCGFASDCGARPVADLETLADAGREFRQTRDPAKLKIPELLVLLLNSAGGPIEFQTLVNVAAAWTGQKEAHFHSLERENRDGQQFSEQIADRHASSEMQLINRQYMQRLWQEISALPLLQRRVVLLNLKDSAGGRIHLFDLLGIASVTQIAAVLELDALTFAALWKELPLDDARIARDHDISIQDVANRRSSARHRLARRMKKYLTERFI